MSNEEFIEAERCRRRELVRFFSNDAKPERERWVVREFLKNLSIPFSEGDFTSAAQSDDVDVVFRNARFQVKELTDPDCRRYSEIKEDLKRAEDAIRPQDLFDTPISYDLVWVDAYPLIHDRATNNQYPPRSSRRVDLLFYITRTHAFLAPSRQSDNLSSLGWRSVSCLIGKRSYVLAAASHAPLFLRDRYSGSAYNLLSFMPMKNRPCAYCGCTDSPREKGHVLPRFLYPDATPTRLQWITVPECQRCKMLWQDAEEHFRNILTVAGEPNKAVLEQWERVVRDFRSPKRRLEDLWASLRPVVLEGVERHLVFPAKDARFMLVTRKIIRGLCHHHGLMSPLPDRCVEVSTFGLEIPAQFRDAMTWCDVGSHFFRYGYWVINQLGIHSAWSPR